MKNPKCIFCKIGRGEVASERKFLQGEDFLVLLSANPQTSGHSLVIPKKHYNNLADLPGEMVKLLFCEAIKVGEILKDKLGAKAYVLKVNNGLFKLEGKESGHLEHLHIHVIPRYKAKEGMKDRPKEAKAGDLLVIKKRMVNNG